MKRRIARRSLLAASSLLLIPDAAAATRGPGLSDREIVPAATWLRAEFGERLRPQLIGTSFSENLMWAIACQESGYAWWRELQNKGFSTPQILRQLTLDFESRRPDLEAYVRRTHPSVFEGLIAAANSSRQARGYRATNALAYGYGLFQFDLQHIRVDPAFWTAANESAPLAERYGVWRDFDACLVRALRVLQTFECPDLRLTLARYNGGGATPPQSLQYADHVLRFKCILDVATG